MSTTEGHSSEVATMLSRQWLENGVAPGDVLLLHSSLIRTILTLKLKGIAVTPRDVLQSFIIALGDQGTLLLPLFNFGFAAGRPFDIRSTPSEMGALTEAGRLHRSAIRTGHPLYSFAAIGHAAPRFANLENYSGYGNDSPFAMLHELDGKIGILDLPDQHSMTYYHHVEEMEQVPYRYHKRFRGSYIDQNGRTEEREFGLFVRNLEQGVTTSVEKMGDHLWDLGLYQGARPGSGSGLRVVKAGDLHTATAKVIRSGKAEGMLFVINKAPEKS